VILKKLTNCRNLGGFDAGDSDWKQTMRTKCHSVERQNDEEQEEEEVVVVVVMEEEDEKEDLQNESKK
jgi:hypothetical protein